MNTINDKLFVCIFQHSRHLQLLDELEEEFDDGPKLPPRWSAWSPWSTCSPNGSGFGVTCGEGSKRRTRSCIQPRNGKKSTRRLPFPIWPRPPVGGTDNVVRGCKWHNINSLGVLNGKTLIHTDKGSCTIPCVTKPDVTKSKWSSWSTWSSCSATCGSPGMGEGSQMRTRDCIQPMPPQNIKIAIWRIKNDCMGSSVDKRKCITHCVTKPDVITPVTTPKPGCLGCPMPAEVDQKIVNFALAELSWGDCHLKQSWVENFKYQVKLSCGEFIKSMSNVVKRAGSVWRGLQF